MKVKLKEILMLFMAFGMMFAGGQSFAQEKTISGTVSDDSGVLLGVSIIIKDTSVGTETDFDGKYSIKAKTGDVLVFSYVGYITVEKTVGASDTINVIMVEDENVLDEVIITGQGSGIQKKRLSTTIDVLSAEYIEKLPSNQIDQILQSTTPSAQIRLSSGQPGTASIIRTRGPISASSSSTPVIIVDGVRVDNLNSNAQLGIGTGGANTSALADIPVESIERIEYIKGGAATTLYGADAANGVIQIITKKGKSGKTRIYFESRLGLIKATTDYLKYKRTGEAIFEDGLSQEFKFGLSGGNDKVTYNFASSLYNDDSYNDYNKQLKRSITFGLSAKLSDELKYQGSFSYVGFESNLDFNANTSFSRFSAFEGGGRGDLDELEEDEWIKERDRARKIGSLVDITRDNNRFTNSNKFTYDLPANIQINATVGIDYRVSEDQEVDSNALLIALDSKPEGTTDQAELARLLRRSFTTTSDINITHKADLDDFSFVSIAGAQFFRKSDRQELIEGSGGVDGTFSIGTFPTKTADDFVLENANYGLYFLENIGFHNVAYLELGGRIDKNTSAGKNVKARFLPKIGATYNVSEHDFFTESSLSKYLSNVRLRANYGETTLFARPFAEDKTFFLNTFLGKPAFTFGNQGNPDLVSEKVAIYEVGLDLGFFNNRINLGGTYYDGTTTDALFTPQDPPSTAQNNQVRNIGTISNKGWEFEMRAKIIQSKNHQLDLNASYNNNKNIVTDTGGSSPFNVGGFTVIGAWIEKGQSLGYLRGTAAIKQDDGTYKYEANTPLGDTYAPNFGSVNLNYSFKKFNLFISGDYQFGGKIVDLSFLLRHLRGRDSEGIPEKLLEAKTSPFNYVNFFTFDSDFFKIRNISVTYNFGKSLKIFDNIRVGLTVTNPFNWTSGLFDPETTGSGIGSQDRFGSGGFAYGTESSPKVFMSSIKFQF